MAIPATLSARFVDPYRRMAQGRFAEIDAILKEIRDLDDEMQETLQLSLAVLREVFEKSAESDVKEKAQEVVREFLLPLLFDWNEEPFDQGAFWGSDLQLHSLHTICEHIYTSPSPFRDRSPIDPDALKPWIVAKAPHPAFQKLVRLAARYDVPLVSNQSSLELPLTPFMLQEELRKCLPLMRNRAERAYTAHQDALSGMLVQWSRSFLHSLDLVRGNDGALKAEEDEWDLVQIYMELLQEFFIDAVTREKIGQGARLGSDKNTYNKETVTVLQNLVKDCSSQEHPALEPFISWREEYQKKLRPLQEAQARSSLAARKIEQQEMRSAYRQVALTVKQKMQAASDQGMERLKEKTSDRMQALEQKGEESDLRIEEVSRRLLSQESSYRSTKEQLDTLGSDVAKMLTKVQQLQASPIDLDRALAEAKEIQTRAEKLQEEIRSESESFRQSSSQLTQGLQEASRKMEQVAASHVDLREEIREIRQKMNQHNSGLMACMVALAGFVVGTIVAVATNNPQAGAMVANCFTVPI